MAGFERRSMGIKSYTHVTIGIPAAWHWENKSPSFGYNAQQPSSIKSMSSCEIDFLKFHQPPFLCKKLRETSSILPLARLTAESRNSPLELSFERAHDNVSRDSLHA